MKDLTVKFCQVGCGDGICIRFLGNDGKYHNILIDGGTQSAYPLSFKTEIQEIIKRKEHIDLWIISHTHTDHIGGVLRFFKEKRIRQKVNIEKSRFWFNYSMYAFELGLKETEYSSIRFGIQLRDYLRKHTKLEECITNKSDVVNLFGAKLTILSPDGEHFKTFMDLWKDKEPIKVDLNKAQKKTSSEPPDYNKLISEFDKNAFTEDSNTENGSSIAFLLEYQEYKILFLADSHPTVIYNSLKEKGWSEQNKLKVNYMQLAHHGSKYNTSQKLLGIIECNHFVISGDGVNRDNLPNKETMVRAMNSIPSDKKATFYITHKNDETKNIFKVDGKKYRDMIVFPAPGEKVITL